MRVALHTVLHEGHEAAYEKDHAIIPDDLAAAFEEVGIHDWTIWRSDLDLFHLVVCDDFDGAMRTLENHPANLRWQRFIGPHIDRVVVDPDGPDSGVLTTVWSYGDQISSGSSN